MSDTVEGAKPNAEAGQVATPLPQASGYSWYVLGVLVVVYILNFIDRQIRATLEGLFGASGFAGGPTA